MKNCHVLSAQGWGPGFSGAYCTLRISRRAESLESSRGQHSGKLCLAEAGVLHSHVLTRKKPTDKRVKVEQSAKGITEPPTLFKKGKAEDRHTHSVTSYEFSLPDSLLKKLSPQSPPHSSAREREDSCETSVRSQEHLQMFKYLPVQQKLADFCQLQILLTSYHCSRDPCQLLWQNSPCPCCF